MQVVGEPNELRLWRKDLAEPIGLVPTMGYLHEGHLSLVRRAREECRSVVVSIFVNPTQFGRDEDLSTYPRDLERDLSLLRPLGVDLVWTPGAASMYPDGFQTWVDVEVLAKPLEGAMRPGHFRGVATVVGKLFNAIQPQRAYFGQKDAQQVAVIRRMTKDLDFPIEIVVCPTVREADGLAMSSRNKNLSENDRKAAGVLFRALTAAQGAYDSGERDAEQLRGVMRQVLMGERRAQVQYVSCADHDTLEELESVTGQSLLSMAVLVGKVRLIDNLVIG